jgi:plasmid maintenance system antidote protein VapI
MKSFLRLVLERLEIKQADAARLLGWSPQRVGYLCSEHVKGFPLDEIPHLKDKLGISKKTVVKLLDDYLFND